MATTEDMEIMENVEETACESKFTLRKLNSSDVFKLVRIIGKIGVGNFKKCFDNSELRKTMANMTEEEKADEDFAASVGMMRILDAVDVVMEHFPKIENDLYSFLADLAGMKAKEVAEAPPADLMELLLEVVQKPEFADFIKVVLRFVNSRKAN